MDAQLTAWQWLGAALAAALVGLSKAGFGTGAGVLAVPLMAAVLGPQAMLAVMLLVLITGDIFSLLHYPHTHDRRNLAMLVPGVLVGVALGTVVLEWFLGLSNASLWLRKMIGGFAVAFVIVQFYRMVLERSTGRKAARYGPRAWHGVGVGTAAGVASTLAHAGGPLIALFLLPQKLDRRVFVGTAIKYFLIGNLAKLVPYTHGGLMTSSNVRLAMVLIPWVVVGTFAGVSLNRRFTDRLFRVVVYCLAFALGSMLLLSGQRERADEPVSARVARRRFARGLDAYSRADYVRAATVFSEAACADAYWADRSALNQGLAACQAARYCEAEQALLAAHGSKETIVRLRAAFNLGNAAYLSGRARHAVGWYSAAAEECRTELATIGADGPEAEALIELLDRIVTNLATARIAVWSGRDGQEPESQGAGAPGGDAQAAPDGGDSAQSQPRERHATDAGAPGYAGGRHRGLRPVREILDEVGQRDTGPVLRPRHSERRPGGKNW